MKPSHWHHPFVRISVTSALFVGGMCAGTFVGFISYESTPPRVRCEEQCSRIPGSVLTEVRIGSEGYTCTCALVDAEFVDVDRE